MAKGQPDGNLTLFQGVYYGSGAYVVSYFLFFVWTSSGIESDRAQMSEGGRLLAELLVPPNWQIASWMHYYLQFADVGLTSNLVLGSVSANVMDVYPEVQQTMGGMREAGYDPIAVSSEYARLLSANAELALLLLVCPATLAVAGFLAAMKCRSSSPFAGAATGSRLIAGYLPLMVLGTFLATATLSGVTVGVDFGAYAEISPTMSIGPSVGGAIRAGVVYPLVFGTVGGAVGGFVNGLREGGLDLLELLGRSS